MLYTTLIYQHMVDKIPLNRWIPVWVCSFYLLLINTTVSAQPCTPSDIMTLDSQQIVRICPQDGNPDLIWIINTDTSSVNYSYVLADLRDNIISISTSNVFDLDSLPIGFCRIWGVSHQDTLIGEVGQDVITVTTKNGGCVFLSNSVVTVVKDIPDGGNVTLKSGISDTIFCGNINNRDTIRVEHTTSSGLDFAYVLTNQTSEYITHNHNGIFDLSDQPDGSYFVYGMSYAGDITLTPGTSINDNPATSCYEYSSNFIIINKDFPNPGLVRTSNLQTEVNVCPGDGLADLIIMRNTANQSFDYLYLITDTNDILLNTSLSDTLDFESSPIGVCRIYGMSYSGDLTLNPGDSIFIDTLTSGCYNVSPTFVTVTRLIPVAGSIRLLGNDSVFSVFTCPGDNLPDRYFFDSVNATPNPLKYIITDDRDVVLRILDINIVDFEASPQGVCRVYSVSYIGDFIGQIGDTLKISRMATGCFDISSNYIQVNRFLPLGGKVSMLNGDTILYLCTESTVPISYQFKNNSSSPQKYNYLLTNEINEILRVIDSDEYSFLEIPGGSLRIWGVSFTGNRLLDKGDNISFSSYSDACFEFSENYITVEKNVPYAGHIELLDGSKEVFFCLNSQGSPEIQFQTIDASKSRYLYVLTDLDDQIIDFVNQKSINFDNYPVGGYKVWGVSYTGNIAIQKGSILRSVPFSNDCSDITDDFIKVIRDNPFAGKLIAQEGFERVFTCPVNDNLDFIRFKSPNGVFIKYAYIVTDTLEVIQSFSFTDSIDFGIADEGKCRVYGVAFEGTFRARIGNNIRNIAFSDECWDLSNNYVEIVKTEPPNQSISSPLGDDITICVNDGAEDSIYFDNSNTIGIPIGLVATDLQSRIVGISLTDYMLFNQAPPGVCRVYAVAFTGAFTAELGNFLLDRPLSDDCYTLSDNFVTINRVNTGDLCVTGVNNPEQTSQFLEIFPNPFNELIALQWKGEPRSIHNTQVRILDINGRLIYSERWNTSKVLKINTQQLISGFYYLQVVQDRDSFVQKLFKP